MKKIILIFLFAYMETGACTTFVIKDSTSLLFCRNYDYDFGAGFIAINKRNTTKRSLLSKPFQPLEWISKYGSVTFNQVGIDAPMGGINEKGLTISLMALSESKYPEYKSGTAVNQMEWIQYQLDNYALLKEVIANAQQLCVVPISTPVHYFVCDSLGNIGVLEYLEGQLIIYQGKEIKVPVCSNIPYEQSRRVIKEFNGFGGSKPIPKKWKSVADIIAISNYKIIEYRKERKQNPIEFSFEVLNTIGSQERTQWSVVYDIKNMKIHFKSLSNKEIRTINFYDFNFECGNKIQIFDIQTRDNSTSVKSQFFTLNKKYYYSYKKVLIRWFMNNVEGFPVITNVVIKKEVEYPFVRECK